jgi:hypothetical protein
VPGVVTIILLVILFGLRMAKREPSPPYVPGVALPVILWMTLGPVWVAMTVVLITGLFQGRPTEAAYLFGFWSLATVILFPWSIARLWLIPRGHVRLAGLITRLSFWVWRGDVLGGSLVAASWALARGAHRGKPASPEAVAWIERRLSAPTNPNSRWTLGGAGILAAGLMAEARRDREQARRIIASAGELSASAWPPVAMKLAWGWLCAEAMTRGAWREVDLLARTAPVESRSLAFIKSVAARLTGTAPVPNDLVVQWQWFAAPRRLATRELMRRAVSAPATARKMEDREREREGPEPSLPDGPPLVTAMTLHAHTLALDPKRVTRPQLARLAHAWDAALEDPQLQQQIEARGEALGSHPSSCTTESLAEVVREDLLTLVRAAGLELGPLSEESEILGRAARRLHGELLDALEVTVHALEGRVESKRELPAIDEWQAFLALREQYAEAVALGGLTLRRLAFSTVHAPVCSLAVWLWNNRSERAIGNAMFGWLLAEAIIVDDAEAIRLQERNVGCGV